MPPPAQAHRSNAGSSTAHSRNPPANNPTTPSTKRKRPSSPSSASATTPIPTAKPFVCPHDDCAASFSKPVFLRRHRVTHTDQAQYGCTLCDATFSRLDSHQRHHRRKHPDRPTVPAPVHLSSSASPHRRHHPNPHRRPPGAGTSESTLCSPRGWDGVDPVRGGDGGGVTVGGSDGAEAGRLDLLATASAFDPVHSLGSACGSASAGLTAVAAPSSSVHASNSTVPSDWTHAINGGCTPLYPSQNGTTTNTTSANDDGSSYFAGPNALAPFPDATSGTDQLYNPMLDSLLIDSILPFLDLQGSVLVPSMLQPTGQLDGMEQAQAQTQPVSHGGEYRYGEQEPGCLPLTGSEPAKPVMMQMQGGLGGNPVWFAVEPDGEDGSEGTSDAVRSEERQVQQEQYAYASPQSHRQSSQRHRLEHRRGEVVRTGSLQSLRTATGPNSPPPRDRSPSDSTAAAVYEAEGSPATARGPTRWARPPPGPGTVASATGTHAGTLLRSETRNLVIRGITVPRLPSGLTTSSLLSLYLRHVPALLPVLAPYWTTRPARMATERAGAFTAMLTLATVWLRHRTAVRTYGTELNGVVLRSMWSNAVFYIDQPDRLRECSAQMLLAYTFGVMGGDAAMHRKVTVGLHTGVRMYAEVAEAVGYGATPFAAVLERSGTASWDELASLLRKVGGGDADGDGNGGDELWRAWSEAEEANRIRTGVAQLQSVLAPFVYADDDRTLNLRRVLMRSHLPAVEALWNATSAAEWASRLAPRVGRAPDRAGVRIGRVVSLLLGEGRIDEAETARDEERQLEAIRTEQRLEAGEAFLFQLLLEGIHVSWLSRHERPYRSNASWSGSGSGSDSGLTEALHSRTRPRQTPPNAEAIERGLDRWMALWTSSVPPPSPSPSPSPPPSTAWKPYQVAARHVHRGGYNLLLRWTAVSLSLHLDTQHCFEAFSGWRPALTPCHLCDPASASSPAPFSDVDAARSCTWVTDGRRRRGALLYAAQCVAVYEAMPRCCTVWMTAAFAACHALAALAVVWACWRAEAAGADRRRAERVELCALDGGQAGREWVEAGEVEGVTLMGRGVEEWGEVVEQLVEGRMGDEVRSAWTMAGGWLDGVRSVVRLAAAVEGEG